MKEFNGKVAVITGAASGIGLGIAKRCVQEGMRVVLADVEQNALAQAEKELVTVGGTVLSVLTDVSKANHVEELAKKTIETYGAVHLLFNNAGVAAGSSIWESSLPEWEWVIGVNLWGVIHGIKAFVPIMLSQDTECHVVNTASIVGLLPYNQCASYQVTKTAVVALSEHLYGSLAQQGAKVNISVICPGLVKTRIFSALRNWPEEFQDISPTMPFDTDDEEAVWTDLQAKFQVISPEQVVDAVFTAIKEERFYILTHAEFNEIIKMRMGDILQEQNPTSVEFLVRLVNGIRG